MRVGDDVANPGPADFKEMPARRGGGGLAVDHQHLQTRERLGTAVGEIRIEARTVLARPELSLSELMQLQAGDIIPVSLSKHVPLIVAGRRIALGTVGEHDGRAALKIDKMEQRRIGS